MRYHLTGVDEGKHEIYLVSEDNSIKITIDASDAKWTGKAADIEVLNVPNGATVYYIDDDGTRSYKNYLFDENGAREV